MHAQLCRIEYDVMAAAGVAPGVVRPLPRCPPRARRSRSSPAWRPPRFDERAIPVGRCLFVGSTDGDLAAARAAGVHIVRHRRPAAATGPAAQPADPWFGSLSKPAGR
ncbi:MAG TPA: hypothetical protein VGP26_22795 [Actinophytocola sp.]|nr:hypothetical protein [Actinophytocola sp.]